MYNVNTFFCLNHFKLIAYFAECLNVHVYSLFYTEALNQMRCTHETHVICYFVLLFEYKYLIVLYEHV